jgi:hypothetical protein
MSLQDSPTTDLPVTATTASGENFIVLVKLFQRYFQNDREIVSIDVIEKTFSCCYSLKSKALSGMQLRCFLSLITRMLSVPTLPVIRTFI